MLSLTLLAMMISPQALCQDASFNYIATERILGSQGAGVMSVQYYDGFGRPDLLATGGLNTTGNYIYSMTEYDSLGNASRQWLPAAGGSSPSRISAQTLASYSGSTYGNLDAVSDLTYDALGRVTFRSTAGSEWRAGGRGVADSLFSNTSNSVRHIPLNSGLPVLNNMSCYPAGTLSGMRVTDEDGHRMDVYSDVSGRTVLERRYDGISSPNDTYYLYEHGLLRAVVPMIALDNQDREQCYLYSYDSYGRCTEKRLRGEVTTRYWYDRHGRLSFMQDERLSAGGQYRFFLYDAQGRPVVQGLTGTLITDAAYEAKAVPGSSDPALAGTGYAQTYTPAMIGCVLEQVNYYDSYSCLGTTLFTSCPIPSSLLHSATPNPQSLLTAQVVYDTSGTPLFRVLYYDWQGRCTETLTSYLESVTVKSSYRYSYTGKTTSSTTSLYKTGQLVHSVTDSIRYNAVSDLPVTELLSADGHTYVTVSSTVYDVLGRVSSRQAFNGTVTETYSHDLHGKLTRHLAQSDLYQGIYLMDENLYYASGPGTPCYNGSISSMTDCLLSPGTGQNYSGYTFSYDGMNRLLTATSRGGTGLNTAPGTDLTERMEYNHDSSLKRLVRRGKSHTGARTIDSLTISRNYGQPALIYEYAATNLLTGTFEVVKSGRHRYYFDSAGSLSTDVSRGMHVSYDLNGNPVFLAYNAGSETESGYTADGLKLWTVHRTAAGTIPADVLSDPSKPKPTPEIGTTPSQYSRLSDNLIQSVDVTRYYDGFEFYDRNLTEGKYYFSNGYVSFHTGGNVDYSAIITDYRGSTRVVMTFDSTLSTSNIVQANSYYPSGALVTDVQTSVQLGSTSGDVQTHKFLGKELDRMYGLDWYDLGARRYDAAAGTFWAMDPLCEQYYHISPYAYCAGDPVNMIDPDGRNPIYDIQGNFLGTDNMGLKGHYYVMDKENFSQGMSHTDAGNYAVLGAIPSDVENRINEHYNELPSRPDYDGFVTMGEGIRWAKSHPNALKNPTPDNTLYIDASKLDFGILSTSDFPVVDFMKDQNLFDYNANLLESVLNPRLLSTVYALGRVNMVLKNREQRTVEIINDIATDYDWNVGGGKKRNSFIRINNYLFKLNPNIHGFKTYYYGVGFLNQ